MFARYGASMPPDRAHQRRDQTEREPVDRHRLGQIASGVAFLAICAIAVLVVVNQAGGG